MTDLPPLLPDDVHNRELVSLVHPPDWANPKPTGRYNLVVIGAGTAGLVTAAGAAGLGAKVALIERRYMGGDCLNYGCVPSKALLRSARAAAEHHASEPLGVRAQRPEVDFPVVMQRMRSLRSSIAHHDSAQRFAGLGVDVFFGEARFVDDDRIQVGDRTLHFSKACITTGARPAIPAIPGIDSIDLLTNENLFELTELPARLAILGAGPIGCEMAQAFARFGSRVTLLETMHGVLPRDDRDAAAIVRTQLEADGVQVACCARETRIELTSDGIALRVRSHDAMLDLRVDRVLVAAGRKANLESLRLDAAGVQVADGRLVLDDYLRTTNRRIFAAGDVCGGPQFTHAADAMARIVIRNALFEFLPRKARLSKLVIPWCTYTSPEVAHVGVVPGDESDCRTIRIDFSQVDRAVLDSDTRGFLKVHTRSDSDRILGATIVDEHAGEIIGQLAQAMVHGIGLGDLASVVHPYPTRGECIKRAADALQRTRLTPTALRIFGKLMSWQR